MTYNDRLFKNVTKLAEEFNNKATKEKDKEAKIIYASVATTLIAVAKALNMSEMDS